MANLDFFAARQDQFELLRFIFELGLDISELSSEPGKELRTFQTPEDIDSAYELGVDRHGNGSAILLILRSPFIEPLRTRRIDFDPKKVKGPSFRFESEGWARMQLYLGGASGSVLTKSHFGHNSKARVQGWGHAEGVNWKALSKFSNKLQYHIRHRLAVGKAGPCPVLPEALALVREGVELKDSVRTTWAYTLVAGV